MDLFQFDALGFCGKNSQMEYKTEAIVKTANRCYIHWHAIYTFIRVSLHTNTFYQLLFKRNPSATSKHKELLRITIDTRYEYLVLHIVKSNILPLNLMNFIILILLY